MRSDRNTEGIYSTMTKVEMAKDIYFQILFFFDISSGKHFAIWIGQVQSKLIFRLVTYELAKLQVHKLVLITFALPKKFSTSNVKKILHFRWISFAILTFFIVEGC